MALLTRICGLCPLETTIESSIVTAFQYMHQGELVNVLCGKNMLDTQPSKIYLDRVGDITIHSGFAYVHIHSTVAIVPAAARPFLRTNRRTNSSGVGSTWMMQVAASTDYVYFVDGQQVDAFYDPGPTTKTLNSPSKRTFTYVLPNGTFAAEASYSSTLETQAFADYVKQYAMEAGWNQP